MARIEKSAEPITKPAAGMGKIEEKERAR